MPYLRNLFSSFFLSFSVFDLVLGMGLLCTIGISCNRSSLPLEEAPPEQSAFSEADSLIMAEKFDSALKVPDRIDSLLHEAKALKEEKPELTSVYNTSYARFLILTGKLDDARTQVESAMGEYREDSLHYDLAKYHNLMAAIEAYSKAHEESVQHFKQAIKIYEAHDDERQASIIKFNLANIFFGRLDYESAYLYSREALQPLEVSKDTANLTLCLSVLSIAETNLDKLEDAERHARRAINLSEKHPDFQGQLFSNYAMAEVELGQKNYSASIERLQDIIIRGESQQMWQWLLPVRGALLKAYVAAEDDEGAVRVGEMLIQQAADYGNRDIQYSTLKNLAIAQGNLGHYAEAFGNLKKAEKLFRENMSETTERVLRETLVKYETEQKNNIILQQENSLSRQQTWNVILIGSVLLILVTLIWIWKNAQQKNKLLVKEKENEVHLAIHEGEERERKRLAGELHDGIASNLVALKLKLENRPHSDGLTEDLLPLLRRTHEEVRHTAHNLMPLDFERQSLSEALHSFLVECDHEDCEIIFQSNQEEKRKKIKKQISLIIYRAVQELVQNTLKHANASAISVQLMLQDNTLRVSVEDNGKGFDTAILNVKQRSGLKDMVYRLQKIGGKVDVESSPGYGTTVFIHLQNVNS